MNFFESDSYYASNDEMRSDSLSNRESYPSSLASTPSDFDDDLSDSFRNKTELELLLSIFEYLDEMNLDLVFTNFEELKTAKFYWISKMCLKFFKESEVVNIMDKVGKRMTFYSTRVNIEVLYWLTDWMDFTSKNSNENSARLSNQMVNEHVLNAIRILLSTTCHLTIRSVLDFVHFVALRIRSGFAKMTLSHKLKIKLDWIAHKKHPLNYLSSPSLGSHDKVIENRLRCDLKDKDVRTDFSVINDTHALAKEVISLIK